MAATASTIEEPTPTPARRLGWPRALVEMARPLHIALILVIFASGLLLAVWRGTATLDGLGAIWPALLSLVAASAAVHMVNEGADSETDRLTTRTPFSGGSGALEASGLRPRVPLLLGLLLATGAGAVAITAATSGFLQPAAAAILLLGLVGGVAYSLPPLALMRRGWGEPLNALLGALLLPLFGVAAVAGAIGPLDVVAFLPFLFVVFASVLATAWPDRAADAATGKRTMQVRLAPRQLRAIAVASLGGFVAATALSVVTDAMPLAWLGLLVSPLLLVGLLRYTRLESPIANVAAMVGLSLITLLVLAVVAVTERVA